MNSAPATRLDIDLRSLPFVVDTSDVVDLDEEFSLLVLKAQSDLDGPTVIETSARNFDVMVPKALQRSPMWVLWLPEKFSAGLEDLAAKTPSVWELSSVDLLKRRATIEWANTTHRICVDVLSVDASLSWAASNDAHIVIALVTASRTALCALRVDEEFILDLQLRGTRCDYNYRPVREFDEEELAVALTRSVLMGNEPTVDEDGLQLVHMVGRHYMYDQPRCW